MVHSNHSWSVTRIGFPVFEHQYYRQPDTLLSPLAHFSRDWHLYHF